MDAEDVVNAQNVWKTLCWGVWDGNPKVYVDGHTKSGIPVDILTALVDAAEAAKAGGRRMDATIAAGPPEPHRTHLDEHFKPRRDEAQEAENRTELRKARARLYAEQTVKAEINRDSNIPPRISNLLIESREDALEEKWVVDGLLPVGGRMVLGGYRKAGKSVVAMNLAVSMASGWPFLGMTVHEVKGGVLWLNLELTVGMAQSWTRDLASWVDPDVLERIHVAHLRGSISEFIPTEAVAREALVEMIRATGCSVVIVDPVSPMMGSCGLDLNKELDVQQFLNAWNQVAELAEISEIVYVAHVGKASARDEEHETVAGSMRWEAAVDSFLLVGRVDETDARWVKAEGRDVKIENVSLTYDHATKRVTLHQASRQELKMESRAREVYTVVLENPGINQSSLRGDTRIHGSAADRNAAIAKAVEMNLVTFQRGANNSKVYYPVSTN